MEISKSIDKSDSSSQAIKNDTIKNIISESILALSDECIHISLNDSNQQDIDIFFNDDSKACKSDFTTVSESVIDSIELQYTSIEHAESSSNITIGVQNTDETTLKYFPDLVDSGEAHDSFDSADEDGIHELPDYRNSGEILPDPSNERCERIATSCSLNNISGRLKKNRVVPALKGTRGYECPYRVTFPDNLIANYLEPCNPWSRAIEYTTEDLVMAYLTSCEIYNLKIIPSLFQQLKAINDFTKRNETFTLKGEKLHYRSVETIEEVFKRVQFRTIDVENTHLDAETSVILFEIIEFYQSCVRLNISNNKSLGVRGWHALSRLIKNTPTLKQVDLRNCSISEQMMPVFCRALRLSSFLTILHLENSIYSGRHMILLVASMKMNTVLKELYLGDNKLMPTDGINLGAMFKFNTSLYLLDIRNNHLQDVGSFHLFDGLRYQNEAGLRCLNFCNNQLTQSCAKSIALYLLSTKTLETLNLSHNAISNDGIFMIKDALLVNKTLLHLDLQSAKIQCHGAISLAEYIAEPCNLIRLDLRDNNIFTAGLMALSLGFKVNLTLRRLDLDKRPKKEPGVKDYNEQQSRLLFEMAKHTKRNLELSWQNDKVIGSETKHVEQEEVSINNPQSSNYSPTLNDIKNASQRDSYDEFIPSPIEAKALLSKKQTDYDQDIEEEDITFAESTTIEDPIIGKTSLLTINTDNTLTIDDISSTFEFTIEDTNSTLEDIADGNNKNSCVCTDLPTTKHSSAPLIPSTPPSSPSKLSPLHALNVTSSPKDKMASPQISPSGRFHISKVIENGTSKENLHSPQSIKNDLEDVIVTGIHN